MMRRRDFLKTGAAALAAPAGLSLARGAIAADKPGQLNVLTWGGAWGNALKEGADADFTAETGIAVAEDTGTAAVARIDKLKSSLASHSYDVVQLYDALWPFALAADVIEPIDGKSPRYKNLKDVYPRFIHPHWVATIFSGIGIAFNATQVKDPPAAFKDLWRPEFKGRVVLPDITDPIGLDLVPIGALASGKAANDAEAGFEMLKRMAALQPIWAKDRLAATTAFRDGKAVIGIIYASEAPTLQAMGAPVKWVFPKEGAISATWGTGIVKGTKSKEWAESYLDLTLAAKNEAPFSKAFGYAGTNSKELGLLTPELQARVRFSADELKRLVELDHSFIAQHRVEWTDRWKRTVGGG
ncbi:MAG: PotD/PotF family extracellular solute-binding protein [Alphaproteobacteria bacterium]